jgi:Flp pilus assembly protein TadD
MALRLLLRLLLVAIAPHAVRSGAGPAPLDQLWRRAMMLYDQKQWGASAAVLQQLASQQRSPNASVEAALAAAYHQTDHLHLAQLHYERALAVRPNDAATLVNAGFLYGETHQHRLAVTCFERAIEVDTTQAPRVLHALALSHHYLGDYTTADSLYNQVPRTAHTAQYHYDRAVTLERLGNVVAAANAYNAALLLDQEFAVAWHNIAALHQKYGNAVDSIRNYKVRQVGWGSVGPN